MDQTPNDEAGRLAALDRFRVLYSEREAAFDAIASLVRATVGIDFAAVTLIDEHHQWLKADAGGIGSRTTPRSVAFCNRTIRQTDLLEVPDAGADPRFAQNPLVIGEPGIRSYLGAPLVTVEGYRIGAVCALGRTPRSFTEADRAVVRNAATVVMEMLDMRVQLEATRPLGDVIDRRRWEGLLRVDLDCGGPLPVVALVEVDDYAELARYYRDRMDESYGAKLADKVFSSIMDLAARVAPVDCRIARLGTTVFGVALPRIAPLDALGLFETVREMAGDHVVDLGPYGAAASTVSIGVVAPGPGEGIESLLFRADATLDEARVRGQDSLVSHVHDASPFDWAVNSG